jgi:hypothetical protein
MFLPCPECRDEQIFEQPSCIDGHGPDCPEWMCRACGFGLFLATYPEVDAPAPASRPGSVPAPAPHAPVRHAA